MTIEKILHKEEKLLSVNRIQKYCYMCGSENNFKNTHRPKNNFCETCQFWYDKVKLDMEKNTNVLRVNGEHYTISEPLAKHLHFMRGMGGNQFTIKFNDGRIVHTDNLWHQGRIPIAWREYLPDNAEFING